MEQPEKTVLVYVFDGFADWESAYVCAELGRAENPRTVRAVAADREPIRSMGGLTVLPDCTVAEAPERFDALLLIGGEAWLDGSNDDVLPLVQRALDQGALVGGICNAATFLAEHGFLDDRARTGNTVEFMRQGAPHYQGAQHFVEAQAVAEGGIITANGSGTLEFAREVLRLLDAKQIGRAHV